MNYEAGKIQISDAYSQKRIYIRCRDIAAKDKESTEVQSPL